MNNPVQEFDFEKTCRLAHLDVANDDKQAMENSINDVLGYMKTLNNLPIDHLEPSSHAAENNSYLREDEPIKHSELLMEENAPDWQESAFWVPQLKV